MILTKPLRLSSMVDGRLYLSQCPGKQVARSRDTAQPIQRDLETDLKTIQAQPIEAILCLLNKYELRTLGVDEARYQSLCRQLGIEYIPFPIMEGGVPEHPSQIFDVLERVKDKPVLCHCRGGVGRAGMIAACYLLKEKRQSTVKAAVEEVRRKRDPRSVETSRQMDMVKQFREFLKNVWV